MQICKVIKLSMKYTAEKFHDDWFGHSRVNRQDTYRQVISMMSFFQCKECRPKNLSWPDLG